MLRIFDRYIIRQFLGTFFFILVLIMAIAVVFDISEKTEDFAKMSAGVGEIVREYYVNFVIYYANFFSGLLIFLAVILFTSRLAHRSEVIAALSSGISFPRLMWPYFLSATFLMLLALAANHLVLPAANKERLAFEEEHIRVAFQVKGKNIHREITPGTIAYVESFNAQKRTGYRFSLEQWTDGRLTRKLMSERAVYDSLTGRWRVEDWTLQDIDSTGGRLRQGSVLDTLIPLVPKDLGQRNENAMSMTTAELDRFVAEERMRGSDTTAFYLIEKHQRSSAPFATYVFTLIGVSISSRKVRGGTGVHLALGVLLVLLYIFSSKITTVAATNAGLDPLIAVWLPNLIFGAVGVWLYRTAPK
ncbi:MAG: LptF/LptG family permease [Flavobacteriales bacterium]|jgi:lipopolysaccharide export system permease protein|nr:LptF/LptG family permease [Flavobacteriales bacterium]MBK8950215.1 LptF/LptG family permease [Flavobacteriales bacterium]MBK9699362.1 LptF/LptG family permease [Flavobacteriales bacterium]